MGALIPSIFLFLYKIYLVIKVNTKIIMKVKKKICSNCGELRYIWKNIVIGDVRNRLCKSCANSLSQKKKHRLTSTKKSIAYRSPKRAKQEMDYSKKREKFLRKHPLCQIPIPGICTHKATEIHHIDGRIEDKLTDEKGFRSATRECHKWVHANPEAARALGYLI